MRALIIGVTGFAGGHLAEHLLACGDDVLGASTSGGWPPVSPTEFRNAIPLIPWDIGSEAGLSTSARDLITAFQPDCVYHLSAISVPSECGENAPSDRARAINIDGLARVIALAESLAASPRLLFTSSSHVYAANCTAPVAESIPLAPRGGYGKSKAEAEAIALNSNLSRRGLVTIARAFQHTGPRQSAKMMLPQWAEQFARGGDAPVTIYTRGKTIDLSDVRDVVRAYRHLVERSGGGIFNVGSGIPRSTGEVIDALARIADPSRQIVETRPGTGADPVADVSRLKEATGWSPQVPLEQTVRDVWDEWKARAPRTSGSPR